MQAILLVFIAICSHATEYRPIADQCYAGSGPQCERLTRDCDSKIAVACFAKGSVKIQQHETDDALKYMQKACDLGDNNGCKAIDAYKDGVSKFQAKQTPKPKNDSWVEPLQGLAKEVNRTPEPKKKDTRCISREHKDIQGKTEIVTDCTEN